ncbi:hypothetical protein [Telluribacter humicola]|uniref:hypothetical protein n=1 Tax=Telluribacter humicola TaxID=1720261 RepID=UPI001A96A077|nr:hypothetical protein [Telluribacter humicola]
MSETIMLDKITYQNMSYFELYDSEAKQAVESLVNLLLPLEDEITNHPKGKICVESPDYFYITGFPAPLAQQITALTSTWPVR